MSLTVCERMCRLCAKVGSNYRSIFAEKNKIADKISKCLPILVSLNDELPCHICPLCLRSLNISYKLLIQVIETDEKLRQRFSESQAKCVEQEDNLQTENSTAKMDMNDPGFCGICEIHFDDGMAFDSHMESFHHSKWVCNLCQTNFANSEELLQHKHKAHYDNVDSSETPQNGTVDCGTIEIKEEKISSVSEHSADENNKCEPPKPQVRRKKRKHITKLDPVDCDICNASIQNETFMPDHKKIHEPFEFICTKCKSIHPTAYDFYLHKREVHNYYTDKILKYFCTVCHKMLYDNTPLVRHKNCDKTRHDCKYCDEKFHLKRLLKLHQHKCHHQDMMDDETVEKMTCLQCNKVFVDKKIYYDHVYLHDRQRTVRYACKYCEKSFCSSSSRRYHTESVHETMKKYKCETCHKTFGNSKNLHGHKKIHQKLTCTYCKKRFKTVELVKEHLKDAHSVLPKVKKIHTCPQCERPFTRRKAMQDHMNTHSGNAPQSCVVCQKKFRTYAARWAHEQRHKCDAYFCDFCQKKFLNKRHLKSHMMVHMPSIDWPYICEICNSRFPQVFQLTNHMRMHTGERLHLCDMCGSKFGQKSHLNKHLRTVHANQ